MSRKILNFFIFFFLFCWNDIITITTASHADIQVQALRSPIKLTELEEAAPEAVSFNSEAGRQDKPRRQFFSCENHKSFMPHNLMKNLFGGESISISPPIMDGNQAKITVKTPVFLSTCIDIDSIDFAGFHIQESNNIMIGLKNNTTYTQGGLNYSIGNRNSESQIDGYFKCLCEQQITCDERGNPKSEIGSLNPNEHKIKSIETTITIENFDPQRPMKVIWANPWNTADKTNNPYSYNPPPGGWDGEDGCFKLSKAGDVISEEELYLKNLANICKTGTAAQIQNTLDSVEEQYASVREILQMARDEKREIEIDRILDEMKRLTDEYKDKIKEALDNPAADDPQAWVSEFVGKYNAFLNNYGRLSKQLTQELNEKMMARKSSSDGNERQRLKNEIVKINQLLEKFGKKAVDTGLKNVAKLTASNDYSDIAFTIERYRLESEYYRRVHPKDARKDDKINYKNKETFTSATGIIEGKLEEIENYIEEGQRRFEARTGREVYSEYEAKKAENIRRNAQQMIQKFQISAQKNFYTSCKAQGHSPFDPKRCQRAQRKNVMRKAILENYLRSANERFTGHSRRLATYAELESIAEAHRIQNSTLGPQGSYLADYADWGGENFYFEDPNYYESDPYSYMGANPTQQYNNDPSAFNMAYQPSYPTGGQQWQQPGPAEFNIFGQ